MSSMLIEIERVWNIILVRERVREREEIILDNNTIIKFCDFPTATIPISRIALAAYHLYNHL